MKKIYMLFSAIVISATAVYAQPTLPFYEPFSAIQVGTLAPQNGWTGPTGVSQGAQVVDTTLTYAGLTTTAASRAVRVGNQASGGLQTLVFASQTTEVFVSFLINLPVLPIAPENASAYYFALGNGSTGTACMYAFPNVDGTTFELGFSPTPNQTTAGNNKTNRQFALNQTIMVVMASTPAPTGGSGSLDVWVNPSSASLAPGGTPGNFSFENRTGGTQTSINSILLRSGATTRLMTLDEIRVGLSWSDITSNNVVLPVVLKDFQLSTNNNTTTLTWASGTEINFNKYAVQFSNDGINYYEVGAVNGKGSNSNYTFNYAHNGTGYFKLKMIDKDGTYTYSKVLQVTNKSITIQSSPNPIKDRLYINGMPNGNNTIELFSVTGVRVKTQYTTSNSIVLPTADLPAGNYVVKISNNGTTLYSSIITK
jgi:hypothetical protein